MSFSAESPPAGWYPDPAGSGGERYWDGGTWSQVTRPAGGVSGGYPPQQEQSAPYSPYGKAGYGGQMARQPVLAGFWWRVLAAILDNLVLLIPLGFVQRIVAGDAFDALSLWLEDWAMAVTQGAVPPPLPEAVMSGLYAYLFVSMVLLIIYRTVMVALRGGTVGQLITGLRVLRDGSQLGNLPSWGTSAVRGVSAVVLWQIPLVGLIDVLVMLFNVKKQTVHDMIARTIVVKK